MRKAQGFITADGTFYETAQDAELHEAVADLEKAATDLGYKSTSVIDVCVRIPTNIMRFINAYHSPQTSEAAANADRPQDVAEDASDYTSEDGAPYYTEPYTNIAEPKPNIPQYNKTNRRTEASPAPVQQQQTNSRQPMSDLRRSIRSKAVRNDSPVYGAGMRGGDAPSIRGSAPVSTALQTELAETLRQRREAHLRGEALAEYSEDSDEDR